MFGLDGHNIRMSHMARTIQRHRKDRESTQLSFDRLAAAVRKTVNSMDEASKSYVNALDDKNTAHERMVKMAKDYIIDKNDHTDSVEDKLDGMGLG